MASCMSSSTGLLCRGESYQAAGNSLAMPRTTLTQVPLVGQMMPVWWDPGVTDGRTHNVSEAQTSHSLCLVCKSANARVTSEAGSQIDFHP